MIHIIHTPAAELARRRQIQAARAAGIVLPPGLALMLWALCIPLSPAYTTSSSHTLIGIPYQPATLPSHPPAPQADTHSTPRPQLSVAPTRLPHPSPLPPLTEFSELIPDVLPDLPTAEPTPIAPLFEPELPPSHTPAATSTTQTDPPPQVDPPPSSNAETSDTPASSTASPHATTADYTPPAYLDCPQPSYPPQLRQHRIQGSITLLLSIDTQGHPTSVEILQSSHHPTLDRHARNWVLKHWRLTPARRGNTPITSRITTTLHFTLH